MNISAEKLLINLRERNFSSYPSDVLLTWDLSQDNIEATLLLANLFRSWHREGHSFRLFDSGLAVSIFRDKSTRTRFSFASAANSLGLGVVDLDEEKSQVAHGETVRETATMISFMAEIIGIRDDLFLGAGHSYMVEVADALQAAFEDGILHQRPSVINLQCDVDHPTQTLSDLAMLESTYGSLAALQGKKLAMTWAYSPSYGKPLSVPQGVIGLMTRFGMEVVLAHPEGYDLIPEVVEVARKNSKQSGGSFTISHNMTTAFENADIVYPKSWAPYSIMEQRTKLLPAGKTNALVELEQEALAQNARFTDWECNGKMMNCTHSGKALYMHCLPADISGVSCRQGEVSKDVFERYRNATYRQASFKPFVIAAMMALGRLDQPLSKLEFVKNEISKQL
ncbi:MAG: knotted carbamoyltransferase YgeW [Fidelibacterota bacterium]